jgi:hypothetical protein
MTTPPASTVREDFERRIYRRLTDTSQADPRLALPAPSGLYAIPAVGHVRLGWDPVPGAAGYVIERTDGPDGQPLILDHGGSDVPAVPACEFADTGLSDGVDHAEANGLRTRTVALLYAARNALLPNVTAFGLSLGAVVGGSVLVEGVFSYPGLGNLLYIAVTNHDFPLMQALFLVITVSMLVTIFVVDLLDVRIDPRVRRA